jgi:serine/threonine protein kinase
MVDLGAGNAADAPTLVDGVPSKMRAPRSQTFLTAQQAILSPGTVLAQRYEIRQILGEGGMGAVYKAEDRELNRPVALKVIRPDLAGNKSIIDRAQSFRLE